MNIGIEIKQDEVSTFLLGEYFYLYKQAKKTELYRKRFNEVFKKMNSYSNRILFNKKTTV
jgi:hypothetical protein